MSEDTKQSDQDLADEWAAALEEQVDDDSGQDDWAAALEEQADAESSAAQPSPAPLNKLDDEGKPRTDVDLDMVLDIPVTISMEIGRTRISIRNLLQLSQGSVVELDRLAGEPMDVLVNDTLIAHGEVVVVNDKFGIRLTDVISAAERIKNCDEILASHFVEFCCIVSTIGQCGNHEFHTGQCQYAVTDHFRLGGGAGDNCVF